MQVDCCNSMLICGYKPQLSIEFLLLSLSLNHLIGHDDFYFYLFHNRKHGEKSRYKGDTLKSRS